VLALAALFAFAWVGLAISPRSRQDWALENALTIACVVALALSRNQLPLSRISYTALFIFLSLHSIGAHYTYSEVPYDVWIQTLTGRSISYVFGLQRNYYDRFVHFSYGVLLVYPIRDILMAKADVRGIWSYYLPIAIASSTSLDYEVIEWGVASVFGGDLGVAYLGTQGDVWDAQKDMALAVLGAILSMSLLAMGHVWRGYRRAARDMVSSGS
jgi:putative membrane protein